MQPGFRASIFMSKVVFKSVGDTPYKTYILMFYDSHDLKIYRKNANRMIKI